MYKEVKRAKTPEQALASLMRLCSKAERSSGDARRLMYRWGVEKDEQDKVLHRLISEKFIDDRRYAGAYVREKTNLSGWGAHKIRTGLAAKGIAKPVIEEALSLIDKDVSVQKLNVMLARKLRTVKGNDNYEIKGKMIRYGLSLGYDYESVGDAVDKLLKI